MIKSLKTVLLCFCLIAPSLHSCLSESLLKEFGFATYQTALIYDAPTVCIELAKNSGICVPQESIKEKIENDNKELEEKAKVIDKITELLEELEKHIGTANVIISSHISQIRTSIASTKEQCINGWNTVQQGITCFLSSILASSQMIFSNERIIKVFPDTAGPLLDPCIPIIDAICLFTTGFTISTDVRINNSLLKSKIHELGQVCVDLKATNTCKDDSCKIDRYEIFLDEFFLPYNYDIFQSEEFFKGIKDNIAQIDQNTLDWAFDKNEMRRLLEIDNTLRTRADIGGIDAKLYGDDSGVKKVMSIGIVNTFGTLSLITLLLSR